MLKKIVLIVIVFFFILSLGDSRVTENSVNDRDEIRSGATERA